jgi:hypothetical protein
MSVRFTVAAAAALIGFASCSVHAAPAKTATPVIVELFTSEGCNSCPPADKLLRRLETTQPVPGALIIGLEEHVDYWNHLGWSDLYSGSVYSDRQNQYAAKFGSDTVYTPEMVVNGSSYFVGNDSDSAVQAISKAADDSHGVVALTHEADGKLAVHISGASSRSGTLKVYLAVTESGITSNPTRGENRGAILTHSALVRSLSTIGVIRPGNTNAFESVVDIKLASSWKRDRLQYVVFVQNQQTKAIVAAGVA